ncbi:major facilitator superfamily transporter [Apiospora aurea]|uniref:Major facilitator superfamily transporter n=1 Tax=Apiospora aurea TaxID=335848 RepID=A0ABR1QNF4_9PEZI
MLWGLTYLTLETTFQKAFGSARIIGVGNTSNFISAWIFRSSRVPHYMATMATWLVLAYIAAGLNFVTWWWYIMCIIGVRAAQMSSGI